MIVAFLFVSFIFDIYFIAVICNKFMVDKVN